MSNLIMNQLEHLDNSYFDPREDDIFYGNDEFLSLRAGDATRFANGESWYGSETFPLAQYEDAAQKFVSGEFDWFLNDSLESFDNFDSEFPKLESSSAFEKKKESSPLLGQTEVDCFELPSELETFWQGASEGSVFDKCLGVPLSPPLEFIDKRSTKVSSERSTNPRTNDIDNILMSNETLSLSPAEESDLTFSTKAAHTVPQTTTTFQASNKCTNTQVNCPRLKSAPQPVPLMSDALKSLMTTSILARKAVEFLKRRQCLRGRKPKRSIGKKKKQLATQPPIERKKYFCSYANCLQAHIGSNCGHKLERHVSTVHLEEHGIYCEICDKTFSRTDSLLRHQRQVHDIHLKKSDQDDEETKQAEGLANLRLFHLKEYDAVCS